MGVRSITLRSRKKPVTYRIKSEKKKSSILGVKRGIPPVKKTKGWGENRKRHSAYNK
tara:strand:+ start:915 stop:1085 length:171 start_codon:yes stop_codon:yes gene_type:complete